MAYTVDILNTAAGTSYQYDILALNAYIIQQGGTGGHQYRIDALNELCTIAGANAGWNYEIDALNAISVAIGGTGLHKYEDAAWTEIAGIGLGLPSYKSDMAYWSGDFDFNTNQWLDKSGNANHADLVSGNCIQFVEGKTVTLTLSTARTGATVTLVNGSADNTAGVTVVSGNIQVVSDTLTVTDRKIYSITLSSGDEFRLTSGHTKYCWAAANMATLGGTEATDWVWTTTDLAHLNLRYGCSKIATVYAQTKRYGFVDASYKPIDKNCEYSVKWEGNFIGTFCELFSMHIVTTYAYCCIADRTNNKIFVINRNSGSESFECAVTAGSLNGWVDIEVQYNGRGALAANFVVKSNGTILTNSVVAHGNRDSTIPYSWSGNDRNSRTTFVKNHYYEWNGFKTWCIYNGVPIDINLRERETGFIYVPYFSGSYDALGCTVLNPASVTEHNSSETKVKMKAGVAALFNNDVNGILFTDIDTPKVVDITKFYPTFGNKIHCDNHVFPNVKDLIVTTSAIDLSDYMNGFRPSDMIATARFDDSGLPTGQGGEWFDLTKLPDLLNETGIEIEEHVTYYPDIITPDSFKTLNAAGKIKLCLHSFPPCFWKFETAAEGLYAYDISPQADKGSNMVAADMGMINTTDPIKVFNAKYLIEYMHTEWGIAYPGGVAPTTTDNNGIWWNWVISAISTRYAAIGLTDNLQMSDSSTSPKAEAFYFHPNVYKRIAETWALTIPRFESRADVSLTDDLTNSVSIFSSALNDSIVEIEGIKYQKLSGYGTSAFGTIRLSSMDWIAAPHWDLQFDVTSIQSSGSIISGLMCGRKGAEMTFGANITINTVNYTNPCDVGEKYKIRLTYSREVFVLRIYDDTGALILLSKTWANSIISRWLQINSNGADCLINNLSVYATWENFSNQQGDSYSITTQYVEGRTYAEQLDLLKQFVLNGVCKTNKNVVPIFHYCNDPAVKGDDGTYEGVFDRSYLMNKAVIDWSQQYGVKWRTLLTRPVEIFTNRKRQNLIINGDFKDELFGLSGTRWGMSEWSYSADETASYSIDGSAIMSIDATKTFCVYFKDPGLKWISFWAKGDFYMYGGGEYEYNSVENKLSSTDYRFYKIPIIVANNSNNQWYIAFQKITTCYIHKLAVWEEINTDF